jgi:hypothetical protein
MKLRTMMFPFSCLAIVLATGCGGGSNGGDDLGVDIPNALITTDSSNGQDVAAAVNDAASSAGDVDGFVALSVSEAAPSESYNAEKVAELATHLVTDYLAPPTDSTSARAVSPSSGTETCAMGGSISVNYNDTTTVGVIDAGDSATLSFNNCKESADSVLNGNISVALNSGTTTNAFDGPVGADWTLNASVGFDRLSVTEMGTTSIVDGDANLMVHYTDASVTTVSHIAGKSLIFIEGTEGVRLTNFDFQVSEDASGGVGAEMCTTTFDFELASTAIDGRVIVTNVTPFQGACDGDPTSGELLVEGDGNTSMQVEVLGTNSIELRIDGNGNSTTNDGDPDLEINLTWADL